MLPLRDKSASCSNGFELTQRPTTVIGIAQDKSSSKPPNFDNLLKKKVNFDDRKTAFLKNEHDKGESHSISVNSLVSLKETTIGFIDEGEDITDRSGMKDEWQKQIVEEIIEMINYDSRSTLKIDEKGHLDAALADVHVSNIIRKFNVKPAMNASVSDGKNVKPKVFPKNVVEKPPELPQKPDVGKKPVVPPKKIRGKKLETIFSKTFSTLHIRVRETNVLPNYQIFLKNIYFYKVHIRKFESNDQKKTFKNYLKKYC